VEVAGALLVGLLIAEAAAAVGVAEEVEQIVGRVSVVKSPLKQKLPMGKALAASACSRFHM
jgi:hypothetical protein